MHGTACERVCAAYACDLCVLHCARVCAIMCGGRRAGSHSLAHPHPHLLPALLHLITPAACLPACLPPCSNLLLPARFCLLLSCPRLVPLPAPRHADTHTHMHIEPLPLLPGAPVSGPVPNRHLALHEIGVDKVDGKMLLSCLLLPATARCPGLLASAIPPLSAP